MSGNAGLEDRPENYQRVSYILKPDGRGTILKILQEEVPTPQQAEHSRQNWELVLHNLKKLAEAG